jgi:hypothetical protein
MFSPGFLDELRVRLPVSEVVRQRMQLKKAGREWVGLSLFNKERTASFTVNDQKRLWKDFSSGKHGDIFSFVMETEGLTFPEAVQKLAALAGVAMPDGGRPSPPRSASPTAPAERKVDEAEQAKQNNAQRFGLEIFEASSDLAGTIALSYLTRPKSEGGRAVDVPEGVSGRVLRFSPRCPWRSEANELVYVPALIGLFRDTDTDQAKAILRRALTADGRKIGKPRYLGPVAGCAIKLTASEDVCQGLHVGEGIETVLDAMKRGFAPGWALGGTSNLQAFPILAGVDVLTIVVDHDRNGAGQRAASECFDRWTAAGREVWCVVPTDVGMDMNDIEGEDQ